MCEPELDIQYWNCEELNLIKTDFHNSEIKNKRNMREINHSKSKTQFPFSDMCVAKERRQDKQAESTAAAAMVGEKSEVRRGDVTRGKRTKSNLKFDLYFGSG